MAALKQPNLLFIFTDQQSARMMSCAGNRYVHTPAMDRLAAQGVRFQRAYCTNPMCTPSRFSLMTGRMPHEIGLRNNDHRHIDAIPESILGQGLGWLLRRSGYETAYGGKVHLPKMTPEALGFDVLTADEREGLAETCARFVSQRRQRPFFLAASFINPHDICYMAIRDFAETDQERRLLERGAAEIAALDAALQLPEGVSEEGFFADYCPPLPENFAIQRDEPEAIPIMQARSPFKQKARAQYDERRWRLHRWAYGRLTERVDAQIGQVLAALEASGQAENTLVVFTSDHGDMDAAHRMEHKTAFYEEAAHVPLIIAWPGVTPAGGVDAHLVSNGLDLLPTFCDYAGAETPGDVDGRSLRPLAEGKTPPDWRTALPVESEIGRMIVTGRYKYMVYDEGKHHEQLIDLVADPGETRNAARDPEQRDRLRSLRTLLAEMFPQRTPSAHSLEQQSLDTRSSRPAPLP
jgi:choline-sulfatase